MSRLARTINGFVLLLGIEIGVRPHMMGSIGDGTPSDMVLE